MDTPPLLPPAFSWCTDTPEAGVDGPDLIARLQGMEEAAKDAQTQTHTAMKLKDMCMGAIESLAGASRFQLEALAASCVRRKHLPELWVSRLATASTAWPLAVELDFSGTHISDVGLRLASRTLSAYCPLLSSRLCANAPVQIFQPCSHSLLSGARTLRTMGYHCLRVRCAAVWELCVQVNHYPDHPLQKLNINGCTRLTEAAAHHLASTCESRFVPSVG